MSLIGLEEVIISLQAEMEGIKNRTREGLMEAAKKVEAASNNRVPREYGNLVGSSYSRVSDDLQIEVGYTAAYATYVHENLEMKLKGEPRPSGLGAYWGPRGESKFLEKTLRDNEQAILDIVRKHADVESQKAKGKRKGILGRIRGWFGR